MSLVASLHSGAATRGCLAVLWLAVAVSVPAQAQQVDDASRRATVEQKRQLVARILEDSPASRRIEGSDHEEARKQLAAARAKSVHAGELLDRGDLGAGDAALNEAMAMISRARQMVPDSRRRVIEHRVRYEQLAASVDTMLGAARRQLERAGSSRERSEVDQAAHHVEEARSLAGAERFEDATRVLMGAERTLVSALRATLGGATLDYTLRFESPAEELAFEIDRFNSLHQLVPLAIAELRPGREAAALVDRHVKRGTALREAAAREAARREWPAALKSVREASDWMQRALLAAGLVTPPQQ